MSDEDEPFALSEPPDELPPDDGQTYPDERPPDGPDPADHPEPEEDYITPPEELHRVRTSTDPNSLAFNLERTPGPEDFPGSDAPPKTVLELPRRAPAQRHSPTSIDAADRIEPKAGTLRARVLEAIRGAVDGLTDEEGQKLTGINPNTYRPRRVELWEAGWIVDRNRTRKVTSGNEAVVWYARQFEGPLEDPA